MEMMESEPFLSLSNEYHSLDLPLLMDAQRKINRPLDSLCKKTSEDLERLEGKRLVDAMETFTLKMCGAVSFSNYAPVMTIIMLIGVLNVKEKEGTPGFRLARKLQKVWQEYSSLTTSNKLTLWKMNLEQNHITGGLREHRMSTWEFPIPADKERMRSGRFGLKSLNQGLRRLTKLWRIQQMINTD